MGLGLKHRMKMLSGGKYRLMVVWSVWFLTFMLWAPSGASTWHSYTYKLVLRGTTPYGDPTMDHDFTGQVNVNMHGNLYEFCHDTRGSTRIENSIGKGIASNSISSLTDECLQWKEFDSSNDLKDNAQAMAAFMSIACFFLFVPVGFVIYRLAQRMCNQRRAELEDEQYHQDHASSKQMAHDADLSFRTDDFEWNFWMKLSIIVSLVNLFITLIIWLGAYSHNFDHAAVSYGNAVEARLDILQMLAGTGHHNATVLQSVARGNDSDHSTGGGSVCLILALIANSALVAWFVFTGLGDHKQGFDWIFKRFKSDKPSKEGQQTAEI